MPKNYDACVSKMAGKVDNEYAFCNWAQDQGYDYTESEDGEAKDKRGAVLAYPTLVKVFKNEQQEATSSSMLAQLTRQGKESERKEYGVAGRSGRRATGRTQTPTGRSSKGAFGRLTAKPKGSKPGVGIKPKVGKTKVARMKMAVLPPQVKGRLTEVISFKEALINDEKRQAKVTLISAGLGNARDKNFYTEEALQDAVKLFEGASSFLNHSTEVEEAERPERDVRDKCGWFSEVFWDAGTKSIKGTLNFAENEAGTEALGLAKSAVKYAAKYPDKIWTGLSIDASGPTESVEIDGVEVNQVTRFDEVRSTDIVTHPARGGKFEAMLESMAKEDDMSKETETKEATRMYKQNPDAMKAADKAFKVLKDKLSGQEGGEMAMEAAIDFQKYMKAAYQAEDEDEDEQDEDGEDEDEDEDEAGDPKDTKDTNPKPDFSDEDEQDEQDEDEDDEDEDESESGTPSKGVESVRAFAKSNLREVEELGRSIREKLPKLSKVELKSQDFTALRDALRRARREAYRAKVLVRLYEGRLNAEEKIKKSGLTHLSPKKLWSMTEADQDAYIAEQKALFAEVAKKFGDTIEGAGSSLSVKARESKGDEILKSTGMLQE